jgi:phage FluMu gp28-like protein
MTSSRSCSRRRSRSSSGAARCSSSRRTTASTIPSTRSCTETRAGKAKFKLVRTTFDDALRDGLYVACASCAGASGPEAEAAWAKEIRDLYGDAATEELDCIPKNSGGRYLGRAMLEARAVDGARAAVGGGGLVRRCSEATRKRLASRGCARTSSRSSFALRET